MRAVIFHGVSNKFIFYVQKNNARCFINLTRRFSGSAQNDEEKFVVHGPESPVPIPGGTVGEYVHKILLRAPEGSKSLIDGHSGKHQLYSDLLQKSINLATALRRHGYSHQKTVLSICSENHSGYFIPVLASLFNASIMQPLSPLYTQYELSRAIALARPKVVFCSEMAASKIWKLKTEGAFGIEKILLLDKKEGSIVEDDIESIEDFTHKALKGEDENVINFRPEGGDSSKLIAFICSSSGTTGLPKGVAQSQLSVLTRLTHGRNSKYYRQDQTDRILGLIPFFHTYGLSYLLGCISSLQTVIYLKRFEEDLFLKTIQDYQINVLILVPPLAVFLAKSDKVSKYDLSSVKDIFCGAASLDQEIAIEVLKRLSNSSFRQALGMTESTSTVTMVSLGDNKLDSCGQVQSFISGAVRDPDSGKLLGPGQVGELCWKGPLLMMGYYKDKLATDEAFTQDGWYKSGDLGYYDEDGYFYVVDRLKEIIKYKGNQVSPAELEAVLINHPEVRDAGVVGKPDELAGELPLAFIIKNEDSKITADQIQNYVKEMVSPHKHLRGGVIFTDSIPRNPSGKILRRLLKSQIKAQS